MTTRQKENGHRLNIEIRGFAAFKPIIRADGKMALMKVGVQVNPLKRDYYDALVFGPDAKNAGKYVEKGSIVQVKGILEFSVRRGRNGKVKPKATVITNKVEFRKRGEEHHAKVELAGELATRPYASRTANGTEVSSFEVKTVRSRNGKARKDGVGVSVFGASAVACNAYLYRGRRVAVKGDTNISVYLGKDGKQKASLDVRASKVAFLTYEATEKAAA